MGLCDAVSPSDSALAGRELAIRKSHLSKILSEGTQPGRGRWLVSWVSRLVVQDDAEEAALNGQSAVVAVVDKAQVPELVHEMTDS